MSYILDALKKAEQERKRGKAPDFMNNHGQTPQQPNRRLWVYALLIVLIAIAGGMGWWFGHGKPSTDKLPFQSSGAQPESVAQVPKTEPQPASPTAASAPAQPAQPAAAPVEQKTVAKAEPAKQTKPPAKTEAPKKPAKELPTTRATDKQPGPAAEKKPDPKKIYSINELPDETKKDLPTFTISTHMYSSERAERLVSINGNIGREGQEIMPGILLDSVLPDGVILKYKGYRFKISLR